MEYAKMQIERNESENKNVYNAASLTGSAFAGKLKSYDTYFNNQNNNKVIAAPKVSKEEFEKRLEAAKRGKDG